MYLKIKKKSQLFIKSPVTILLRNFTCACPEDVSLVTLFANGPAPAVQLMIFREKKNA